MTHCKMIPTYEFSCEPVERFPGIRTDFLMWLKMINGEPVMYHKIIDGKISVHFGYGEIKWYTSPENFTGVLKFVCGPPANVTNDNFQL